MNDITNIVSKKEFDNLLHLRAWLCSFSIMFSAFSGLTVYFTFTLLFSLNCTCLFFYFDLNGVVRY